MPKRELNDEEKRIHGMFRSSKAVVAETVSELEKYQSGESLPVKTCYGYINKLLLGGIRPQQCIAICGRSGTGKSYAAQKILESILDKDINPQADDYVLLRCEFEMNPMDLLLRRISREMDRPMADIIGRKQTASDEAKIRSIVDKEVRDNIFYIPSPCSVDELRIGLDSMFLPAFKSKKMVFVSIDHIGLTKVLNGDPQGTLNSTVAMINDLKLKHKNVVFIVLSQLNRDIEKRTDPKNHAPVMSDIYNSDTLAHLCSLIITLHNPYSLNIDKYMAFGKGKYKWLDKFKSDGGNSFKTEGLIFHHVIKNRMKENEKFMQNRTIFVEVISGYELMYSGSKGVLDFDEKEVPSVTVIEQEEVKETDYPF